MTFKLPNLLTLLRRWNLKEAKLFKLKSQPSRLYVHMSRYTKLNYIVEGAPAYVLDIFWLPEI